MYADFEFYTSTYHGDTLTASNAEKWLERSSDYLDTITFHRLETAFPTEERDGIKVRKAVCAIADALYFIDVQRRAGAANVGDDGKIRGAVSSMSSGKESVSYATGNTASIYSAAAKNMAAQNSYTRYIAGVYLSNVSDADGINLLYAGFD